MPARAKGPSGETVWVSSTTPRTIPLNVGETRGNMTFSRATDFANETDLSPSVGDYVFAQNSVVYLIDKVTADTIYTHFAYDARGYEDEYALVGTPLTPLEQRLEDAERQRELNEAARQQTYLQASEAEALRNEAEQARKENEKARADAVAAVTWEEKQRREAEKTRVASEMARDAAEQERERLRTSYVVSLGTVTTSDGQTASAKLTYDKDGNTSVLDLVLPQGAQGVSIARIIEYYKLTATDSVPKVGDGWVTVDTSLAATDRPPVPVPTASERYLWNYRSIVMSDGSSSTTSPSVIGVAGANGESVNVGITDVRTQYAMHISDDPTDADNVTGWSESFPTWQPGKYVWTRDRYINADGTSTYGKAFPLSSFNLAYAAADGKSTIWTQTAEPASPHTGDLWIKTNDKNESQIDAVYVRSTDGTWREQWLAASGIMLAKSGTATKIDGGRITTASLHTEGKDTFASTIPGVYLGYNGTNGAINVGDGNNYLKFDGTSLDVRARSINLLVDGNVNDLGDAIKTVTVSYALSDSQTESPSSDATWTSTLPAHEDGKYVWQRTVNTTFLGKETVSYACLQGTSGDSAYSPYLSNESYVFVGTRLGATSQQSVTMRANVIHGSDTLSPTVTIGSLPAGLSATVNGNEITFTTLASPTLTGNGSIDVTMSVDNNTFVRTFSYAVSAQADSIDLIATSLVIAYDGNGVLKETSKGKITIAASTANCKVSGWGVTIDGTAHDPYLNDVAGIAKSEDGTYVVIDPTKLSGSFVAINVSAHASTGISDTVTIQSVRDGLKGIDGTDGRGIKSTVVTYQAGTSATTAPTGSWSPNVISAAPGQYLWTRTVVTYTDNTSTTTYSVAAQGKNGINGTNGADGRGVKSTVTDYQLSTSGTTAPTGTWSSSPLAPTTSQFLWTRTVITYSDGTTSTSYSVGGKTGAKGADGVDGVGISGVTNHYLASASSSNVTSSTQGWTTTIQTISKDKRYLWNYETINYTNGTSTDSTPCIIGTFGIDGVNGAKGADGADGNGILSITEHYAVSSSNSNAPTDWVTSPVPTMTPTNRYLWNYETIAYTNGGSRDTTKRVIGVYGDKGETGAKGADGSNGVGISSVTNHYLATAASSDVTVSTSGWTTDIQTISKDKRYLWNYETIAYTNGTSVNSTPCIIGTFGIDGKNGINGADGNGISGVIEHYAVSPSNSTAPTSWSTSSVPTMTATNKYLWNYETISYTNGTSKDTNKRVIGTYGDKGDRGAQGPKGADGTDGVGISNVVNYYLATAASSGVTTSTSGWTTDVQTISKDKRYLWNYEVINYTNSTSTTSAPCVIGTYGIDGKNGTNGADGADGNGISGITEHYAVSSSNSTAPSSWVTTPPTMTAANKYLWNYETISYTNGTSKDTNKRVIGTYGDKGADGRGVKGTAVAYQLSSSGTTAPTGTWSTSPLEPTTSQFLWTRTIITYSDNSTSTSYSVGGKTGKNGTNGVGISNVVNHYLASAASSNVTTSTSGWTTDVQTISKDKRYLWNYETVNYTNGTATNSTPCIIGTFGVDGRNGTDGKNGTNGINGVGISGIAEHYAVSTSNSTAPTTWWTSVPTMSATNRYLWNYETVSYTNGTTKDTRKRVIGVYGDKGAQGAQGPKGDTGAKGADGADGADAITLSITSNNGTVFKNSTGTTTLTAHVYRAGSELTSQDIAKIGMIKWYKDSGTTAVGTGMTLSVSASSVASKAVYTCRLEA